MKFFALIDFHRILPVGNGHPVRYPEKSCPMDLALRETIASVDKEEFMIIRLSVAMLVDCNISLGYGSYCNLLPRSIAPTLRSGNVKNSHIHLGFSPYKIR
jgi:hypothetical protein